jgi:hypothetical protein
MESKETGEHVLNNKNLHKHLNISYIFILFDGICPA